MKLAIAGCLGRVGQTLIEHITLTEHALVGGTVRAGQEQAARERFQQAGIAEPLITDSISIILNAADAIIDFTRPEHTLEIAREAATLGKVHVSGTTGLNEAQQAELAGYASEARILLAPNMSVGVNLLMSLTQQVAETLTEEFDIEIYEMHHRHKVDAPSGTALGLGHAAARGRGVSLGDVKDTARDGFTGERMPGRIGFSVARGGDVIGDHTVTFAGMGERIELSHKAANRDIYARGAVMAAEWAAQQPPGLYDMQDVLKLR